MKIIKWDILHSCFWANWNPVCITLVLCAVLSRVCLFVTPWTVACQAPLSMGILQARILEWVAWPPPGDLPNPGIKLRSPALQVDSLLSEPQGKPINTGVGSLSLLQGIFLTQESNQGLLHWRWILYQLSYQGVFGLAMFHCPTAMYS